MRGRVLLVDDDLNVLLGMKRALRKQSFEIVTASSARDGLAVLSRADIDVVVADYEMPGMNGVEFLRRVRDDHPAVVRFMLTGKPSLDVAAQAINEGAISRFFVKPWGSANLAAEIRQVLQQKHLMGEAWRLLKELERQRATIERVEQASPGITEAEKDSHGAVISEDDPPPEDFDEFMRRLRESRGEG